MNETIKILLIGLCVVGIVFASLFIPILSYILLAILIGSFGILLLYGLGIGFLCLYCVIRDELGL